MQDNKIAPITTLSSLKINTPTVGGQGGLYVAQMTPQQVANLTLVQNGTMVYIFSAEDNGTTTNSLCVYQGDTLKNDQITGGTFKLVTLGAKVELPVPNILN